MCAEGCEGIHHRGIRQSQTREGSKWALLTEAIWQVCTSADGFVYLLDVSLYTERESASSVGAPGVPGIGAVTLERDWY